MYRILVLSSFVIAIICQYFVFEYDFSFTENHKEELAVMNSARLPARLSVTRNYNSSNTRREDNNISCTSQLHYPTYAHPHQCFSHL